MAKKGLVAVVNEEQQKEVLEMLSDFELDYLMKCNFDCYKFPLLISFDNKKISRTTSITVCAGLSQFGLIEKDYSKAKAIIEEYLQEKATSKTL